MPKDRILVVERSVTWVLGTKCSLDLEMPNLINYVAMSCLSTFFFFFHHTTCESTCDTLASSAANQGDNTVSVAQVGTATPGATEQLLPLDRIFKRNIYLCIHKINYISQNIPSSWEVCDLGTKWSLDL